MKNYFILGEIFIRNLNYLKMEIITSVNALIQYN